jgi:putative sigma-54 modulation protein
MNLTISGHHIDLTPSIREYVQNKLERIKHHFDYVIDVAVILTVDKLSDKEKRQKAEINLRVRGKDLHAESIAQDLYAAIDTLIDKLDRQLIKYKSKLKNHQHTGIKKIEAPETEAPEEPEAPGAETAA